MKSLLRALAGGVILATPLFVQAQHYTPGVEGIKAATLPPPGVYLRDYNVMYWSGQVNGPTGHEAGPPDFNAFVYANVPRLVWITDTTVLGGYLGVDALLPILYQNITAGGGKTETSGIGDMFMEGTLSWHPKMFDFSVGAGFWAPSGTAFSSSNPDPGLNCWSPMLTAGATVYFDTNRTWAVSALNRYEFNTEDDSGVTPGQTYTLEWGVSKTLAKVFDVGAVGYYQLQTKADSGPGASPGKGMAASVGPEVSMAFPDIMTFVSVRYLYEFTAQNTSQGQAVVLTVTKRF
ncbi:MAG: transporter [Verrucomicrobiota bacterium]